MSKILLDERKKKVQQYAMKEAEHGERQKLKFFILKHVEVQTAWNDEFTHNKIQVLKFTSAYLQHVKFRLTSCNLVIGPCKTTTIVLMKQSMLKLLVNASQFCTSFSPYNHKTTSNMKVISLYIGSRWRKKNSYPVLYIWLVIFIFHFFSSDPST